MNNNEQIVFLLKKLKFLVVPQCKNVGEQLTYISYKEKIIDQILLCFDKNFTTDFVPEVLRVDQQKMAEHVIDRTFDLHTKLLRNNLQRAQEEAAKWKKIALGKTDSEINPNNLCESLEASAKMIDRCTQTEIVSYDPTSTIYDNKNSVFFQLQKVFFKAFQWFEDSTFLLLHFFLLASDKFVVEWISILSACNSKKKIKEENNCSISKELPVIKTHAKLPPNRNIQEKNSREDEQPFSPQPTSTLYVIKSMKLNRKKSVNA